MKTERLIHAGGLLLLPRLRVQNANAISGPLTWGFPSPTAFTGFVHALERKLSQSGLLKLGLGGVGIVCHGFDPQVVQPGGKRTHAFRLTRNPMGKDGASTALVEEGRAHLEVSLLIAVKDELYGSEGESLARAAAQATQAMRLAGGSILAFRPGPRYAASWHELPEHLAGQQECFMKLRRRLLPGFALVQRADLIGTHLAELGPDASALDALLDLVRLNFEPLPADPSQPVAGAWQLRKRSGWLVPLPVGYAGLSPLYPPGEVANARDEATPFRFVESLYSLGQWIGPHRLTELSQLLWQTESQPEDGLYRCINRYADTLAVTGNPV